MRFDGRLLSGISVLVAVIEGGNFTRAGKLIGLSASGVSRSIVRLEQRIGVRLLDRSTRVVRLTTEGSRLYELAAAHLAGLEEAASAASGAAKQVRGHLRVGANSIFARNILAPQLAEFAQRYPHLELTVIHAQDVGDLIKDGLDVAIRFGPQLSSTMQSRLLLETRVLTVAAPSYLEKHGRPPHPRALASHNCIGFIDPRSGKPFEWEFHRDGEIVPVQTRAAVILNDVDTMICACVAGAGIAQVLALGTKTLRASGALVELFPDWPGETYPLYAVRPSRRNAPAKVEAFLEFCEEILSAET